MSKQTVNIGTSANDRTGDSLRTAFNKINENFNELYVALGLGDTTLNLGAFTFTGSVLSTDDSTNITIDRPITVNGEIVVDGDITPKTNFGANLGTPSKRFKDLYLSSNSIDLGGTVISVSGGSLTVGGTSVSSTVDYNNIQNKPTIPADISDLTDNSNLLSGSTTTGDLTGSVFADDSTLLVDGVNGSIPWSVISDVQVTESDLLVDFGAIVSTQIQTNGLPVNTFTAGDLEVRGTLSFDTGTADFADTTIENWTDPNVVNEHGGSIVIAVGGQTATIDNLTVRIVNDGSNNIDLEFNYDPDLTSSISASGDSDNRFSGTTLLAPGNTTWTVLNSITSAGTTRTFTVADHGFHKVYRGTIISRFMPDGGGTVGDAYCILERLR